ncbi:MAG: hypothetical protein RLZZ165_1208 [Bacteroidota bacterium]
MMALIRTYLPIFSVGILVVLYTVGIWGLNSGHRDWFLAATPLTLVLSTGFLLLNHQGWNGRFLAGMAFCCLSGFFIEVLGVRTGLIFGNYAYGETLGLQVWEVPLVIGLNWLLLLYTTSSLAERLALPKAVQAGLAALAMTLLDVLIEPVAMRLDFWQWEDGRVPLQNFMAWFLVSLVLILLLRGFGFEKRNPIAAALLLLQFFFFGTLNLSL